MLPFGLCIWLFKLLFNRLIFFLLMWVVFLKTEIWFPRDFNIRAYFVPISSYWIWKNWLMVEKFCFCHFRRRTFGKIESNRETGETQIFRRWDKFWAYPLFSACLCITYLLQNSLYTNAVSILILTPLYFWLKACIKSLHVFDMWEIIQIYSVLIRLWPTF